MSRVEIVPDTDRDRVRFAGLLRFEARAQLAGTSEPCTLEHARERHWLAVDTCRDPVAIALWARVIWRLVGSYDEHQWLHEPVGVAWRAGSRAVTR